ncbi:MAG TPA: hypothetical protein VHD15_00450 [Hyphomicrobiales bacterium]|nr:hypothetical protein [Hyphomicrobiales bacterium]
MKQSTLLIAVLLILLGLAVIVAYVEWTSVDTAMPTAGYVALWGGIVFSLLIGCGLMGLMFYSSRRGYDEKAQNNWLKSEDDRDDGV